MIEIEKRAPCLTFLPRDKLRRMRCALAQPETRSGENSYKRSSVKPCFQNRDSWYANSNKRSPRLEPPESDSMGNLAIICHIKSVAYRLVLVMSEFAVR